MKLTLITVGKIKEKYLRDAVAEYSKRLSRYCKLEILETADERTPEDASEAAKEALRDKEGKRILRLVREDAYVITLEIQGEMPDSVELADKIEKLGVKGISHIVFIIGGSIGFYWNKSIGVFALYRGNHIINKFAFAPYCLV